MNVVSRRHCKPLFRLGLLGYSCSRVNLVHKQSHSVNISWELHNSPTKRTSYASRELNSTTTPSLIDTHVYHHSRRLGAMIDSDSDEDIKRAIALSLQQPSPTASQKTEVIDLISDDEDDDLGAPLVARGFTSPSKPGPDANNKGSEVSSAHTVNDNGNGALSSQMGSNRTEQNIPIRQDPPAANGILGMMNRKQMEEERRARANKKALELEGSGEQNESRKRKAPISPPATHNREGRQVMAKFSQEPDASSTQSIPTATSPSQRKNDVSEVLSLNGKVGQLASGVQYPDGVIKKTWVRGCPRQGDDIKIEEVLQKDDLELAVLSSFQVDPQWVINKLDDKTKIIWVLQAKDESEKQKLRLEAPKNYRFCFPSMDGNINCMHSKLQLLAHPSHLRIVIPSANLVPYDWGETGVMENVCFLIDLPRHPEGTTTDPGELTHFAVELVHFLTAMGLDEKVISSMRRFDFSRTAGLAFVHSIGGSHTGSDLKRTGYCGLGTAVRKLGLDTDAALSIDFVATSIGSLTMSFIKGLFLALQGGDGISEFRSRTGKKGAESAAERSLSDDLTKLFRIYFPTLDTVGNSKGGTDAGGTICLHSKWYNSDAFPRSLIRDCKSHREGVLMHDKMIFVRPHKALRGGVAWAYVGSANLSEAAWGRLVKDRATKEPKLNCRNWECGVIVPVLAGDGVAENRDEGKGPPGIEVFQDKIPVPMIVPGEDYAGRKPWFYSEQ